MFFLGAHALHHSANANIHPVFGITDWVDVCVCCVMERMGTREGQAGLLNLLLKDDFLLHSSSGTRRYSPSGTRGPSSSGMRRPLYAGITRTPSLYENRRSPSSGIRRPSSSGVRRSSYSGRMGENARLWRDGVTAVARPWCQRQLGE